MSSRGLTILGYLFVLAVAICLQVAARRGSPRAASLGDVLSWVMRSRTGRVGVLVAWGWLGLHFFAK